MTVKFKRCPRCKDTKEVLQQNWIRPDQEFCTACELEMNQIFLQHLGYTASQVHDFFKGDKQ